MDSAIVVAIIGASATVVAALVALKKGKLSTEGSPQDTRHSGSEQKEQPETSIKSDAPVERQAARAEIRPIFDVTEDILPRLKRLPMGDAAEAELLPIAEQLFRRPAFYSHKERDEASALYVVVKTRLIWEQEVIPRLRLARRNDAFEVTRQLLELEDQHAQALTIAPAELTTLTAKYIHNKGLFDHHCPKRYNFELLGGEADDLRTAMLKRLASSLARVGLTLPDLGNYGVMGRSGGE